MSAAAELAGVMLMLSPGRSDRPVLQAVRYYQRQRAQQQQGESQEPLGEQHTRAPGRGPPAEQGELFVLNQPQKASVKNPKSSPSAGMREGNTLHTHGSADQDSSASLPPPEIRFQATFLDDLSISGGEKKK